MPFYLQTVNDSIRWVNRQCVYVCIVCIDFNGDYHGEEPYSDSATNFLRVVHNNGLYRDPWCLGMLGAKMAISGHCTHTMAHKDGNGWLKLVKCNINHIQ